MISIKYIGKANLSFSDKQFPYLGIHGGYEIGNGSRQYSDWCKKAKFINATTLGICELNTLAGTLDFQDACSKAEIKSIIGESITIHTTDKSFFTIKLYVKNDAGWKNLLLINKIINVDNEGKYINENELMNSAGEGLICVVNPEVKPNYYVNFMNIFEDIFYQLDFVEWSSQSKDEQWLNSIKNYLDSTYFDDIPPILISDSYYLDKPDHIIKASLNTIAKIGFKNQSADQYFKPVDDIYMQSSDLFKEEDFERWQNIIDQSISNTDIIFNSIDFKIPVGQFRLPGYEMTEEEKQLYSSNEELLWAMIEKGLDDKVFNKVEDEAVYFERIQTELEVIKKGGFIDPIKEPEIN